MLGEIVARIRDAALTPLPPAGAADRQALTELRSAMRAFSIPSEAPSPSYQKWLANTKRLQELVLSRDPRRFLRWDVVANTMFAISDRCVATELDYLRRSPEWLARWQPAIDESRVGTPPRCRFYPRSSGNLIHHAYHLQRFEETTGRKIRDLRCVLEFGGGYGSLCRLIHNLGFQGTYVVFDLPPFSALQAYYLKALGLPVSGATSVNERSIACVSDIAVLKELLLGPVWAEDRFFVATWSISEAPISVRKEILSLVVNFESFLIAYQDSFGEVNNREFFARWAETMSHVTWEHSRIEHLPGNNYLMATASRGQMA